jgi:myo-inositol-1(or 4)-monophosphatase
MYSAQPPEQDDGKQALPTADLGGRLYLAIRPCSGTQGETARQAQDRVAREIWRRVEVMDYKRPT